MKQIRDTQILAYLTFVRFLAFAEFARAASYRGTYTRTRTHAIISNYIRCSTGRVRKVKRAFRVCAARHSRARARARTRERKRERETARKRIGQNQQGTVSCRAMDGRRPEYRERQHAGVAGSDGVRARERRSNVATAEQQGRDNGAHRLARQP